MDSAKRELALKKLLAFVPKHEPGRHTETMQSLAELVRLGAAFVQELTVAGLGDELHRRASAFGDLTSSESGYGNARAKAHAELSREGILKRGYYYETSIYTGHGPKKTWTDPEHMRWHLGKALEECENILRLLLSAEEKPVFQEWRAALWDAITRSDQEHLFGSYLLVLCKKVVAPSKSNPDNYGEFLNRLCENPLAFAKAIQAAAESFSIGCSASNPSTPRQPVSEKAWYHLTLNEKPEECVHGPIPGDATYLAEFICPLYGRSGDARQLQVLGESGELYIHKPKPRGHVCKVYFRDQKIYAEANAEDKKRKQQAAEALAETRKRKQQKTAPK